MDNPSHYSSNRPMRFTFLFTVIFNILILCNIFIISTDTQSAGRFLNSKILQAPSFSGSSLRRGGCIPLARGPYFYNTRRLR
jgi:hypothetical protein